MADTQFQYLVPTLTPDKTEQQRAGIIAQIRNSPYAPAEITEIVDALYSTRMGPVNSSTSSAATVPGRARVKFEAGEGIRGTLEISLGDLVTLGNSLGIPTFPDEVFYGPDYLGRFVGQQVQVAYLDDKFLAFRIPLTHR